MSRTKLLVGKRLKQRIEYGASDLAYYPSASSWCRAVALQAVQAQRAGWSLPQQPDDLTPSEPLDQELFIYDLSPDEKRQIDEAASDAVGEAGVSYWLRRCFEAELERLETTEVVEPISLTPPALRSVGLRSDRMSENSWLRRFESTS